MVSSNTLNSLSLSACREQNTDSWKPGWDLLLLKQFLVRRCDEAVCWDTSSAAHLSDTSQSHWVLLQAAWKRSSLSSDPHSTPSLSRPLM